MSDDDRVLPEADAIVLLTAQMLALAAVIEGLIADLSSDKRQALKAHAKAAITDAVMIVGDPTAIKFRAETLLDNLIPGDEAKQ
jgi:hypothetical protein